MYKVIRYFTDLQDSNHAYNVGDTYPRQGVAVTGARVAELASAKNRQGVQLIEEVIESVPETVAEVTAEEAEQNVEHKPKRKKRGE